MLKHKKSYFITFEGGDGAGKTTLLFSLAAYLEQQHFSVLKTRAPGGTPLGQEIRSWLLGGREMAQETELFLFLADRSEHTAKVIRPALLAHTIVLCDRFHDSTIAYQAGARGFPLEKVEELCLFASQGLQPDLTFYLDLDPKIGLQRIEDKRATPDRIEKEALSFHDQIRKTFLQLAQRAQGRIHVLDATFSPEMLLQQAINILM